jgi:hypothetical protein
MLPRGGHLVSTGLTLMKVRSSTGATFGAQGESSVLTGYDRRSALALLNQQTVVKSKQLVCSNSPAVQGQQFGTFLHGGCRDHAS